MTDSPKPMNPASIVWPEWKDTPTKWGVQKTPRRREIEKPIIILNPQRKEPK